MIEFLSFYKIKREDVMFNTECGQNWKLTWGKNEYEAYVLINETWINMYLGGVKPKPLIDYIQKTYKEEVKYGRGKNVYSKTNKQSVRH